MYACKLNLRVSLFLLSVHTVFGENWEMCFRTKPSLSAAVETQYTADYTLVWRRWGLYSFVIGLLLNNYKTETSLVPPTQLSVLMLTHSNINISNSIV